MVCMSYSRCMCNALIMESRGQIDDLQCRSAPCSRLSYYLSFVASYVFAACHSRDLCLNYVITIECVCCRFCCCTFIFPSLSVSIHPSTLHYLSLSINYCKLMFLRRTSYSKISILHSVSTHMHCREIGGQLILSLV